MSFVINLVVNFLYMFRKLCPKSSPHASYHFLSHIKYMTETVPEAETAHHYYNYPQSTHLRDIKNMK